ncbi:MAG TPA: DNA cytosine methyltransferase [Polyangiales bacterium]|nr:DNA cytosine methyltransferase [Polyangiales bacterium]
MGAGARGFLDAEIKLPGMDVSARFECVGGIDFDPRACADFEYLTGVPELCADVQALTVADGRRTLGHRAPDVVFFSPPCKGASGLLSATKSKTPKYAAMNELALVWTRLMLKAWADDLPPLVLLENVPRLKTRAAAMLAQVRKLLRSAGYVLTDGFHDCGELGGLAQRRKRYLLVARLPRKCAPFLYQPPAKRVRGCGEVLSELPVPGTVEARAWGRMHELPKLSWLNWVRLALIPAGGDWRDLEGVLAEGQARREQFKRHAIEEWCTPTGTIGGSGSNGVTNVADPRAAIFLPAANNPNAHHNKYRVKGWDEPAGAVIGANRVGSGAPSVADPRVSTAYDAGYAVLNWEDAARTIAGKTAVGCGAYSVADIRVRCSPRAGAYGVLAWDESARTITGSFSVDNAMAAVADPRKPPPFLPIIIAQDGTWHRPMTKLELAALQGLPLRVNGKPLELASFRVPRDAISTSDQERIGNAVPPPAARAIAEKMLIALTEAALGAFSLSSDAVWVAPEQAQ